MVNIFRPSTWLPTRPEEAQRSSHQQETTASSDHLDQHSNVVRMDEPKSSRRPQPRRMLPVRERIEQKAYQKWCDAGCPSGDDVRYWLEAEREVLDDINQGSEV